MTNIDLQSYLHALLGGVLIGLSAFLLLAFSGRIAGISGLIFRSLTDRADSLWRFSFLAGFVLGGVLISFYAPNLLALPESASAGTLVLAGLLVGFGSVLGNGCTSGHGV